MPTKLSSLMAESVESNHALAESVPDACIDSVLRVLHSNVQILTAIYEWIVTGLPGDEVRKTISANLASHQLAIDILQNRQTARVEKAEV